MAVVQIQYFSFGYGVNLMLQFWLERGADMTKHYRKLK
jgi:hypothetical protein